MAEYIGNAYISNANPHNFCGRDLCGNPNLCAVVIVPQGVNLSTCFLL